MEECKDIVNSLFWTIIGLIGLCVILYVKYRDASKKIDPVGEFLKDIAKASKKHDMSIVILQDQPLTIDTYKDVHISNLLFKSKITDSLQHTELSKKNLEKWKLMQDFRNLPY